MDLQKQLQLFHANPPRLFPHLDFQRPMIESLLAMTAATDVEAYEDRLEKFNKLCDEHGVQRFDRVIIGKETIAAPKLEVQEGSTDEPEAEAPKKRGRRKKAESSPNS